MELNKNNVKTLVLIIAAAILIFLGLQNMNIVFSFLRWLLSIFTPLLIGLAFAFVFNVPLKFFEKKLFTRKDGTHRGGKARRPVSLVLSVLLVLGVITTIMFLIIPELINSLILIIQNLPDSVMRFQEWIEWVMNENPKIKDFFLSTNINWNDITNNLLGWVQDFSINFVGQAFGLIVNTISFVINIFLGLIFSVYFLAKKEQLSSQFKKLTYAFLPENKADTIVSIFKLTSETFSRSVSCSMIECTILATITIVSMSIFGFPYAMMVGCIVGVMALIPMFGVTIGIVIGTLLIMTVNPTQAVWFVVMMIIIQQIEGNLIYPRVASSTVGLPPLWVMTAIIVGGGVFGFVGMLVAVPITSVVYTILQRVVNTRLRKRKISKNKFGISRVLVTVPLSRLISRRHGGESDNEDEARTIVYRFKRIEAAKKTN